MLRWGAVGWCFVWAWAIGCSADAAKVEPRPRDAGEADVADAGAIDAAQLDAGESGGRCRADEPRLALTTSPNRVGFGRSVAPSCAPAAQEFLVRNDGASSVVVHEIVASTGLTATSVVPLPAALEPGGALTLAGTFTPTELGSVGGSVILRGPDGCVELGWRGVGLDEATNFGWSSALAVDFGVVADGTSRSKELRFLDVSRSGAEAEVITAVTAEGFDVEAAPDLPWSVSSCTEYTIRVAMRGDRETPTRAGRLLIESRAGDDVGIREYPLFGRTVE